MSHRANELESSGITHRLRPTETLGHVRLQDEVTGETLLVPQPSSDPNDPLNCIMVLWQCRVCRPYDDRGYLLSP
ncbi:hypothetical protein PENSUB_6301 [Penicillium subrubescens]|uniref:Uncharacterized protein n=1 Tax=Penicillium subrubescens TaxID=1316194 RepID=A0A1Q5U1J9_9EURO|nr:hypothetical protein PENSUB_6301 [Penicillium subrubescens]